MNNIMTNFNYTPKVVREIVKHYQSYLPSSYVFDEFDNISCLFADIDNAIIYSLSPKEKEVINAIKKCGDDKVSDLVGISYSTVKFHLANASDKISKYLNGVKK